MERKLFGIALKWLVLAVLIVTVVAWGLSHVFSTGWRKAHQAQTETRSAEAMQEAGQAAVATVLERTHEEVALHDLVGKASKEIDNAPNQAAARAATLNAACQLRLYRDDPACAVRGTDSQGVGRGGGGTPATDVHQH